PKEREMYVTRYELAQDLKGRVKSDFEVTAEMREEYYRRLKAKGIDVDRKAVERVPRYIDRQLEFAISRVAFGDSTAHRRTLDDDVQLRTALELLRKGQTQRDLFALATPSSR
ncbi:MAG: hypothetical protein AB1762_00460, partial [Gemmatimonadota bacterium]